MAFTCENCGTRGLGSGHETITGRRLCQRCNDELMGASAALVAGGGVPEAIATAGWYARMRQRLKR